MVDSDKPSIFDEASKKLGKKKIASPSKPLKSPSLLSETEPLLKIEEAEEILRRMKQIKEELELKLEAFHKETGIPGAQLQEYFSDSQHFTSQLWEKMEAEREKLEAKVSGALGLSYKKRKVRLEEKTTKDRKGKTLGSRRQWIPVR